MSREGGMGVVYKAHDTKLDRIVALKFLPQHLTRDVNEKERFYHEARAAAALTHQNIAVVYEIGDHDDQVFIAMEYVEGRTLKQLIEKESDTLSIRKVLDIAIQICEGLAAAHEKGIVHRDIKSDNIMVTPKGQVKIMDFGLAKLKGASKLTQEGSTLGTAAYMSPEQAQGEDVDQRSDIFSFGIVLYELLTCHLPFRGDHHAALLYSIVNEEPQPIARFNDKVSPELERIVYKALSKDKEERYQHIDDMLADLRRERKNLDYARAGTARIPAEPLPPTQISGKKKNPLKIVIPAAVVALLAILFFILNPFKIQISENSAAAATGNSLAVMYFQNLPDPGDSNHTGEMLTNLLMTSLSQVSGLDVISRERLLEIEKDMGQANSQGVSPSLAIQIAKRAGVTTMLTGNILQLNPTLAVTTNLINVKSGRVIGSQQLTNFSESQIFELVDSLSHLISNSLEPGASSGTEIRSVADVTTKSPEAYRAYVEGLNDYDKVYWKEANSAFQRAVGLDPSFAMAYFYLANTEIILGETGAFERAMQKAAEYSDKATERDRLQILALNYMTQNNLVKSIYVNRQLIDRYPHETQPYINLGYIIDYSDMLSPHDGIKVLLKGTEANPTAKSIWNVLAYSYAVLGEKQEALNAVNQYIKLAPAEPNPYDTRGDIYGWFMEYDSSAAAYRKATELRGDFDAYKLGFLALLRQDYTEAQNYFQESGYQISSGVTSQVQFPLIEIEKGEIKQAQRDLTGILNNQLSPGERVATLEEMVHVCYEIGQYPEMLQYARLLSAELHKNPSDEIYGRDYVAWALAMDGKITEANNLVDQIEKSVNGTSTALQCVADYSSALVSFGEGKFDMALQRFRKVEKALPPNHEPNIFYAICLLKNGNLSDAVNELKRLAYWPATADNYLMTNIPGAIPYWPIQSVKAHYWLGVAYERLGEKAKALDEYKKFSNVWNKADFNSPELSDAKSRVASLEGLTEK